MTIAFSIYFEKIFAGVLFYPIYPLAVLNRRYSEEAIYQDKDGLRGLLKLKQLAGQ